MQDPRDNLDAEPANPELIDVLELWRRNIELELRVSAPATVVSYNPTTQRATVQLGALPVAYVGADTRALEPIEIPEVPVRWLGTAAGYVTMPLEQGDTGHVLFTDRCLTEWLNKGKPVDPINGRTHALGDAIFEPGLRHKQNVITPATDLQALVVESDMVKLGRGATNENVPLGQALLQLYNQLVDTVNDLISHVDGHTHAYLGDSGVPAVTTPPTTIVAPPHLPLDLFGGSAEPMTSDHLSGKVFVEP